MDESEEPFLVIPEGLCRIIIRCKKASDRSAILKLKYSVIMRHIKKCPGNETDCFIDCKNEAKRDKLLNMILMTMYTMRKRF